MNIQNIKLKNFKCFEEASFQLNSQFTVIVGDNGKGKSAILDALAILAGTFLKNFNSAQSRDIKDDEIRRKDFGQHVEKQFPVVLVAEAHLDNKPALLENKPVSIEIVKEHEEITFNSSDLNESIQMFYAGEFYAREVREGQKILIPIIAFYGTERLWLKSKRPINPQAKGSRLELGYQDCMKASSDSTGFLSWMKTSELIALQQKKAKGTAYDGVKNAISNCVDEWQEIYFDFEEDDLVGSESDEDGKEVTRLPFRLMSDGVRNMIGMVADIAYRCVMLNPHLGENAIKETTGIVLIDELDLHLHPSWQKRVVADLKETFPKIQFVASTHSPFIIQSLESDELINLDRETDVDFQGLGIEEITETVMGVKHTKSKAFVEMEDIAAEYYKLVEQGTNAKNETELNDIKDRLDKLLIPFTEDPAFAAQLKMERLAKLGK